MRRTWALRGETPVIPSAGSWKNLALLATVVCAPYGRKPKLFLACAPGAVDAEVILKYLRDLRRHLGGKKLLLFWDGLMAHRANSTKRFLKEQGAWLRVVRLPAYAPELNPPEYLWAAMKTKDLANLRPEGLSVLGQAVRKSYRRIRKKPDLLAGFLRASSLF